METKIDFPRSETVKLLNPIEGYAINDCNSVIQNICYGWRTLWLFIPGLPTPLRAFRAWKISNGKKNVRNWNTRGHQNTHFVSPLKPLVQDCRNFAPASPECLQFVIVVPLVWDLFHVIQLAPRILRWFLDVWNICGPLSQYNRHTVSFLKFHSEI